MKLSPLKSLAAAAVMAVAMVPSFADARPARDVRDSVVDQRGDYVRDQRGDCVRTQWTGNTGNCGQPNTALKGSNAVVVNFDFNKSTITPEGRKKLDALLDRVQNTREVELLRVAGFADRIGNPAYNRALSQRRANSVRSYLVNSGRIAPQDVELDAFGEARPITDCNDQNRSQLIECLYPDRRVEVRVDYRK